MPARDRIAVDLRRRELFRLGAGGAFALAAATSAARLAFAAPPPTLALDARRAAVLAAIADALYPGGDGRPGALEIDLVARIDEEMYFAMPRLREQFGMALDVIEYGSLVLGWWGRFTRLTPQRRLPSLAGLFDHPLALVREVAAGVTQVVKAFYYADERTWASIGYDGTWVPRKPAASHAHYREQVARAAASPTP